jgi:hypothetical protein
MFVLLAVTIAMIMTVTPILLIQEAKAFSTQKCFDHPKQCKWTQNHCLKKEPNVCDDTRIIHDNPKNYLKAQGVVIDEVESRYQVT